MNILDWIVLIFYGVSVVYLGIRLGKKTETVEEYFSGGRSFKWWAIGLSVVATQVSAVTFIGAPGWAYNDGLAPIILNLNIPLVMWFVGGTFAPFFYNSGVISIYEYLEGRFGYKTRFLMALAFIFKMLIVVGAIVYAPSLVLSKITGLSINVTIAIITILSIFYTILGGIQAVIWTDVIQMFILWLGIAVSLFIAFQSIPESLGEVMEIARAAGKINALNFEGGMHTANTFWAGMIGGGILHIAYFGVDQAQVQRVLTAKSMKNVKYSLWFSGLVSVVQMFIFLFVGIILYVYYKGVPFENPNDIYINFALENLPNGVLGLIIAAIFAAAMSSIDSALNSMSTVYIKDIHNRLFKKELTDKEKLAVSKKVTMILGIVIAGFAFLVSNSQSPILEAISKYGSYLLGAMLGVFILGIYSKKANEKGVVVGFIAGVLGVATIASVFKVYWMWNNFFGLLITLVIGYCISIITGGESKNVDRYTIKGQKKYFEENNITEIEEGIYIRPGRFERNSYILVIYCIISGIVLYTL